jgi:cell fate regulator YaaT (PSP1 superfamily)
MVQETIDLGDFSTSSPDVRPSGGCSACGKGEGSSEDSRCGNGLEKVYPTTAVRFGYMRYIGEFSHAPNMKFTCGARVVIQTKRGIELGEQVSLTCSGCDKSVSREQMKDWVDKCGSDSFIFDAGRLLRESTAADLAEYARIEASSHAMRVFAQGIANRLKLALKVAECEHLFGGERIIFFFTAPERVDYRVMVKELAKEYRTRIEMRQIGARDEARLLTDYETCGREVCCKVFLKTLRPISMRMAKLQKATLDPSQVSGRCGRLKCCLRYEHVGYEELDKKLPRVGVRLRTQHGDGVVVSRQILTQLLQIRTESDERITVVIEDILAPGEQRKVAPVEKAEPREPREASQRPRQSEGKGPSRGGGSGRRPTKRRSGRGRGEAKPKPDAEGAAATDQTSGAAIPTKAGAEASPDQQAKRTGRRRRRQRNRRRKSDNKPDGESSPPPSGS